MWLLIVRDEKLWLSFQMVIFVPNALSLKLFHYLTFSVKNIDAKETVFPVWDRQGWKIKLKKCL
jgi:hypothetical protein